MNGQMDGRTWVNTICLFHHSSNGGGMPHRGTFNEYLQHNIMFMRRNIIIEFM